jgi:hypothetical protein
MKSIKSGRERGVSLQNVSLIRVDRHGARAAGE